MADAERAGFAPEQTAKEIAPMFRYAALGLVSLVSSAALAQQVPRLEGSATPSASTGSTAPSKAAVSLAERRPGDHWTIEARDEITGTVSTQTAVVTEVTPTGVVSLRSNMVHPDNSHSESIQIYDQSWNQIRSNRRQYFPYDASQGTLAPLAVGKTWTFQFKSVDAGKFARNYSGTSTVTGQETVTTKAGTFETFRIETTVSSNELKDPTRPTQVTRQSWYAPAIAHWVRLCTVVRIEGRLQSNQTSEIVEFGRQQ